MKLTRRWLLAGCLTLGLTACGGDPEPATDDPPVVVDDEGQGERADPPPEEDPPTPDVVIKMDTFGKDVLDLQPEDIILVRMAKSGNTLKATLVSVRPRMLTVTAQGSSITSRFKPEEVEEVRLLYRDDPTEVTFSGDAPLNEEETWLDHYDERSVLESEAAGLWKDRFARNVPLTVKRSFRIPSLTFLKRRGRKCFFVRDEKKEVIRQYDQVKLVGLAAGFEPSADKGATELGDVYLYLVRHGQKVRHVHSLRPLSAKYLDTKSVKRFLRSELVVLAVARPGSTQHLKIVRVPGATARKYRQVMAKTPGRPEVRGLRARRSPELEKAERQVRSIYRAVDLTKETDLEEPIVVRLRVPSAEKGLRLVPFTKELGLD